MKQKILFSLFIWCFVSVFHHSLKAQNAPVTIIANVGSVISGQTVNVPVTVTNFTNIGSISLSLDYDSSELHFVSATINPLLAGNYSTGDNVMTNKIHRLVTGWYGSGVTLTDGTWIINYAFTYISGTPTLHWFDDGASCEYTDDIANSLNDAPFSTYYINGLVTSEFIPVAFAGNDTLISYGTSTSLHAAYAGASTVNYHWSPENLLVNPNVQNPQTIPLTASTNFHLVVTDQVSLYKDSDDVVINVTDSLLTGASDYLQSNFQIFPNPAKDYFIMKSAIQTMEPVRIKIYSSNSEIIKTQEINNFSGNNEFLINVKNLPSGSYYINVSTENLNCTQKLLILRN